MGSITALFHDGRIELAQPVDWPDGTVVAVTTIDSPEPKTEWPLLPPLDVSEFRAVTSEDDLF